MSEKTNPETFILDATGANGTPFRFILTPSAKPWGREADPDAPMVGSVQYLDRRYTLKPGEPGYGPNHTNEHGQSCGPKLSPWSFITNRHGFRGWHEVSAWDLDAPLVDFVGSWIQHTMNAYGKAHGLVWGYHAANHFTSDDLWHFTPEVTL